MKTFILRNEANNNTVTMVQFSDQGVGTIASTFENLEQKLYEELVINNQSY